MLLALAPQVSAQGIESVLRPGELIRGHAKWEDDCSQCHVRFNREAQNGQCMDCHKDIGADVRAKTGLHGRFKPQPCRDCHTDHKGRSARIVQLDTKAFDHQLTDYLLRGKHVDAECTKCHTTGKKYSQAPSTCDACHRKDDVHKASLGPACADCHDVTDWKKTMFDHGKTRFTLTGKHVDTKCIDCHKTPVFKEAPTACLACHRKDDDSAKGHHGRFGEKCDSCHTTKGWKPSTFNHDTDTKYPLRGKHRDATCASCHKGSLYRDKLSSTCIDCHRADDQHKGSLGADCQACHVESRWTETRRFDHARTKFPLRGKHPDAKCVDCHKGAKDGKTESYKVAAFTCVACHRKDDTHKPTLGNECQSCHVERGWKDLATFNHDKSRFELRGRHIDTKCADCHKTPDYRAAPGQCIDCHLKDDKHAKTLGAACADCHGEMDWKKTPKFDHQKTKFPLRNAHAAKAAKAVECKACHRDLKQYRDTPLACNACHKKDDKHEGQLGERCDSCHRDTRWKDTEFDHSRARFPLVSRHVQVDCAECHKSERYRDAPRECVGCHLKDDKHKARLGTTCESCHNARNWRLWAFDHSKTSFVLDGAHAPVACEACHKNEAPKGKVIGPAGSTCLDCHRRDDKHDGAFGARCDQCHFTTDWKRLRGRPGTNRQGSRGTTPDLGRASWFTRAAGRRTS